MMPNGDDAPGQFKEGDVYKFCKVANLVVPRRLKFEKDKFVTCRIGASESHKSHKPKTWELSRHCKLDPKTVGDVGREGGVDKVIRPPGVWSIQQAAKAAQEGDKIKLFTFKVTWPNHWTTRGAVIGLGFTNQSEAEEWYAIFQSAIRDLAKTRDRSSRSIHVTPSFQENASNDLLDLPIQKTIDAAAAALAAAAAAAARATDAKTVARATSKDLSSSLESSTPQPSPRATFQDTGASSPPQPIASSSSPVAVAREPYARDMAASSLSASSEVQQTECWVPYKHVNGVAIYRYSNHSNSDDDNAQVLPEYMASCVVRGPPQDCVDVLMNPSWHTTILGPATDVWSKRTADPHKQTMGCRVEATGLPGRILAPRELVVERLYKKDEDGIHAIFFNGSEKEYGGKKSKPVSSWWKNSVPASATGGYTIAPLEGQNDESVECLVTCVLRVDLGGICSENSWLWPVADMLGFKDAFVERMLMAVILVKDEVEQKRFALQPFKMMAQEAEKVAHSFSKKRSATMVVRTRMEAPKVSVSRDLEATKSQGSRRQMTQILPPSDMSEVPDSLNEDMLSPSSRSAMTASSSMDDWGEYCPTGTLDSKFFHEIHRGDAMSPFRVRGANYLKDRKKIPAGEPMFSLGAVDLVTLDEPTNHIARFLPSIRRSKAPFSFITNLIIPGTPLLALVVTFVCQHHPEDLGAPAKPNAGDPDWRPFDYVLYRFFYGDEEERNSIFKLIPHVNDGSWVIKQSVGATPVILGRKLKTKYHVTPRYIEMDVDISANATAAYVVSMVRGAIKSLSIDLGFVLEGSSPHELPEQLVGAVRFNYMDMGTAVKLDTSREIPMA